MNGAEDVVDAAALTVVPMAEFELLLSCLSVVPVRAVRPARSEFFRAVPLLPHAISRGMRWH